MHSGQPVNMTMSPSAVGTGIRFFRTDLGGVEIPAGVDHCGIANRATILTLGGTKISTPEHLMAALTALQLSNVRVDIDREEVPILDGSALPFVQAILGAGIVDQGVAMDPLVVRAPMVVGDADRWVMVCPSLVPTYTYILDLSPSFVGTQVVTFRLDQFEVEIAPARTFGFLSEVEKLRSKGLAKGADLANAVVIGATDYVNDRRFPDELARHKVLDMIGDLGLVGRPILGHFVGFKSGHETNVWMARQIAAKLWDCCETRGLS